MTSSREHNCKNMIDEEDNIGRTGKREGEKVIISHITISRSPWSYVYTIH